MDIQLKRYDDWLEDKGPAALVIREYLMPVEGKDGALFPPTFAAGDGFPGGYNIDSFPDGGNVCLIDSVGSQANRMEPLFAKEEYAGLVPNVVIRAGEKRINFLDAGHRAGDAIARCSALKEDLREAFLAVQDGNVEPLARIAPTSIVFGAWDSRDTQAKLPRLIASTIRAFNVRGLTRSAQYIPATDYVGDGLLDTPADKKTSDAYAERGFVHVPATGSHGGVIATGGVRRDASLHLAALRLLRAGDPAQTKVLGRYILGLALTAFTYPPCCYLRQGCNLVLDPDKKAELKVVYGDGRRIEATLTHSAALAYAKEAAAQFGLDPARKIDLNTLPDREVEFERQMAKEDVSPDGEVGVPKTKKSGGRKASKT